MLRFHLWSEIRELSLKDFEKFWETNEILFIFGRLMVTRSSKRILPFSFHFYNRLQIFELFPKMSSNLPLWTVAFQTKISPPCPSQGQGCFKLLDEMVKPIRPWSRNFHGHETLIAMSSFSTEHVLDHVFHRFRKNQTEVEFCENSRTGSMNGATYFLFQEHFAFSAHFYPGFASSPLVTFLRRRCSNEACDALLSYCWGWDEMLFSIYPDVIEEKTKMASRLSDSPRFNKVTRWQQIFFFSSVFYRFVSNNIISVMFHDC